MNFSIRKYRSSDIKSLYKICLITSNKGKDVELLRNERNIIGDLFISPYVKFEPDLCFVLLFNDEPCGYILGTKDTKDFYLRCEREYFLPLRKAYIFPPEDDYSRLAHLKRVVHIGHKPKDSFDSYPAHLHINILPIAKGKGMGRKLMTEFMKELSKKNVIGLHLEVGKTNTNAIQFYRHIGFDMLKEYESSFVLGIGID